MLDQNRVSVICNNSLFIVGKKNYKKIISQVYEATNLDFKYWSTSSLLKLYYGMIEVAIEICEEQRDLTENKREKWVYSQRAKKLIQKRDKKRFRKVRTKEGREAIIKSIYDDILEGDELPLLRGFGFSSKHGDRLVGDAERRSCKFLN